MGVAIFLSTKTLPTLVAILQDADVEPPALTMAVMSIGRLPVEHPWILPALLLGLAVLPVGGAVLRASMGRRGLATLQDRLRPPLVRRVAVASALRQLAELLRCGVPLVDALRVIAPSCGASPELGLRGALTSAANQLQHGAPLHEAFDHPRHFDGELRQLLRVSEESGDLDALLDRIAARSERQAERMITKLATLLEPAVILLLAALVGTVVLAAVLPLIRIQEIL